MTPLLENRRIAGPLRLSTFGPSMPDIHRWYQISDLCSSSPFFRYTASMRHCGRFWIGVLLYCGIQSLLCTRVPWTDSQATLPGTAYAGGDRSEWSRCSSLLSLLVLEVGALFISHWVYSIQKQLHWWITLLAEAWLTRAHAHHTPTTYATSLRLRRLQSRRSHAASATV